LTGKRLKILEVMNTIDTKIEWKEFTKMVGLNSSQTMRALEELAKKGFVKKFERGYSLTGKGKAALRKFNRVPQGKEFHFYTEIGHYTGMSAKNLRDFYNLVKKVDPTVLAFHNARGDFENWVSTVIRDPLLAKKLEQMRNSKSRGEDLRIQILKAVEEACQNLHKLSCASPA